MRFETSRRPSSEYRDKIKGYAGQGFFDQQPHIYASLAAVYDQCQSKAMREPAAAYEVVQPLNLPGLSENERIFLTYDHVAKEHIFIAKKKNEGLPGDYNIHVKGLKVGHLPDLKRCYNTNRPKFRHGHTIVL